MRISSKEKSDVREMEAASGVPAIMVTGLGKHYVLGGAETNNQSFREMLIGSLTAPFRRLRKLQGDCAEAESFWALQNVNFKIMPGEVVGIVGRNGAGKSTLLKILSRITDPSEGRIEIRGRVSSLLEVGTGFHPELTGRENIFLNGAILGMTRREILSKFDEIVSFAEVDKFLDTPVKRYSSGMYVRLAFAVAAHLEPEILVVDEVLAVGDAAFQKKCLGKMGDVSREGRTVLFVSHNMGAVRSLCTRVIMLNQGQVLLDADVNEGVDRYLSFGQNLDGLGEISWAAEDAPACEEMSLSSIRLRGESGKVLSIYDATKTVDVEIAYVTKKSLRGMRLVLSLLASDGTVVFSSTNHAIIEGQVSEPGRYVSTCQIPSNLLNEGSYLVNVHVGIPGVKVLIQGREYLTLKVEGSGAHGSTFSEKWPGVIAPRLAWEMKKLENVC